MGTRVDPKFKNELINFGALDIEKCFNCGNCTAICGHADEQRSLPRSTMRQLQLGLKRELMTSLEPWICYYCGDCSRTCPRLANPAENMMAVRRWLTAHYDFTGLFRKIYSSRAWEFGMIALAVVAVLFLIAISGAFTPERMPTDPISINTFLPVEWVHYADWVLALILLFFMATSAFRMWRLVLSERGMPPVPFSLYVRQIWVFFLHMFTQKSWRQCEGATRWFKHLLLFTGYATMFLLIVVFLPWFQMDGPHDWHWSSLFGYYAAGVLLYVSGDAILSRLRKTEEIHKHSHRTDWTFLILLFLVAVTGMILHAVRLLNSPLSYYAYVVHLACAVPIYFSAFAKWSHLVYRPLAMFLIDVREKAMAARQAQVSVTPVRALAS
jgi:ferredoxin